MRLLSLTATNYRGFGSTGATVSLNADLVLLFGPNGFGKTSLAESIEWLFYGTTRRRERGDTFSKNEYDGCFANAHGATPTEVTARVRLRDNSEFNLTRRIPDPRDDAVSITLVDGVPAAFSTIGLSRFEALQPVIAQHDLQSFIHSKPKERRDIISAALGLDELTTLKTSLDGARKAFVGSPPPEVIEARGKLKVLAPMLATIAETRSLGLRWQKVPLDLKPVDDEKSLIAAAKRIAGSEVDDVEQLLSSLRSKRQERSKTVFDPAPLMPPADVQASVSGLTTKLAAVTGEFANLTDALTKGIGTRSTKYAATLLRFWETGLALAPQGVTCPMCEVDTLTAEKRAAVQARLKEAQATLVNDQKITAAIEKSRFALSVAKHAVEGIAIRKLDENTRALLKKLFAENPDALEAFVNAHDSFQTAYSKVAPAASALEIFLTEIPARLLDVATAENLLKDCKSVPQTFAEFGSVAAQGLAAYGAAWNSFEPDLAKEISTNTAIAEIDSVGKALRAGRERRILAIYDEILTKSRTLMQQTEAFLQAKQTQLLSSRGEDIKKLYDMLNPGAQVGFDMMEPGNEQLRLHAKSYGVRMSAAANLSECQLNCLGLAFWLGRATVTASPFGFVVLDDPVQSMDDDHCEAFISTVIPTLCDGKKKQVILLSHERKLIDRLRDLNKSRDTAIFHFDEYEMTGPSITHQVNLAVMLREVKGLAKGNEENRSAAVDKLRKVGEEFIRELHLKITGNPAPAHLENAQPHELLELFRNIPGTTVAQFQGLKDTFDYASPAHHKPLGYSVPVLTNITPHISRLETLMKAYKLLM